MTQSSLYRKGLKRYPCETFPVSTLPRFSCKHRNGSLSFLIFTRVCLQKETNKRIIADEFFPAALSLMTGYLSPAVTLTLWPDSRCREWRILHEKFTRIILTVTRRPRAVPSCLAHGIVPLQLRACQLNRKML